MFKKWICSFRSSYNDPDCKDLKDDNGDDCQYNAFIKHWILYLVLIIIILFGLGIFIYALSHPKNKIKIIVYYIMIRDTIIHIINIRYNIYNYRCITSIKSNIYYKEKNRIYSKKCL